MKKLIAVALAAFSAAISTNAMAEPGRYQLVDATYQFINIRGEEYQLPALILLDTSTGSMKICSSSQYSGSILGRDKDKDYQVRSCNTDFESVMEIPKAR